VLRTIRALAIQLGYPPTLRELGQALGIRSTNGVTDHLNALERRGLVRRSAFHSRGLVVTDVGARLIGMVVLEPSPGFAFVRGLRCMTCDAVTFAPDKPCPICRIARAS
jgi:SOS-response transcriptional repressor LexA